jgi:hypothetical protein
MKSILLRLYPRSWRARYGEEFLDLLEQRPISPSDVLDVVVSAVDARRHPAPGWSGPAADRLPGTDRAALAAIAGGVLFPLGLLAAIFNDGVTLTDMPSMLLPAVIGWPAALSVIGGIVLLLAAILGLGAGVGRRHPRLAWTSVGIGTLSLIGTIGAFAVMQANPLRPTEDGLLYGMFVYFQARWVFGASCLVGIPVATALFATAMLRTRHGLRPASLILAIASLAVFGGFLGGGGGLMEGPLREPWWLDLVVAGLTGLAIGWVRLGVVARRPEAPIALAAG